MKKLILLRHAKSSWDKLNLDDIDRPLSKRGVYSAKLMQSFIEENYQNYSFDVFSSLSLRTKSTCEIVFSKKIKINYVQHLYTFHFQDLIVWLKKENKNDAIFMVGHNPAFLDLIQFLASNKTEIIFPTCALCEIHLNIDSWNDIKKNCGEIKLLQKVKKLKNYNFTK
ncbi:MAG: histidine phosphatase family protein [Proteobacteria bacterium]|nr:histidine phosphatase family protein [Pseudomonadota bacterium]